jgi:hypothetical protein
VFRGRGERKREWKEVSLLFFCSVLLHHTSFAELRRGIRKRGRVWHGVPVRAQKSERGRERERGEKWEGGIIYGTQYCNSKIRTNRRIVR